ncbi:MAG TPA: glycosyltransferase [Gemmatimonadales bacterium]|nr:glycosyltransferase [Gemmatimonadales bacterium]
MRVLYSSYRPYIPQRVDGALYAAHSLLALLVRRGHAAEAVVPLDQRRGGRLNTYRAARALTGRRLLALGDRWNGYRTYRMWDNLLPAVLHRRIARKRPDVVLTQLDGCEAIAAEAMRAGVPVIVWIHDNEFTYFRGQLPPSPLLLSISATDFVSAGMRAGLGYESPVLYPPIDLARCRAQRGAAADAVTLINPVREKGVEIVLRVAELLPHRRFQLVETWPLSPEARRALEGAVARLPNVSLHPSSPEITPIYARTKLLLAPSQWVEAFCTVAFEANVNGIPVVASRIGGIPTTVGEGGILLEPDAPAEAWAQAVESLMRDPAAYEARSHLALANAARPEFDPERIVDRFLGLAQSHVERARAGGEAMAAPRLQGA